MPLPAIALGALGTLAKVVGLGGAVASVKSWLTGPVVAAIAAGVVALGLVIGIVWLVSDAKRDVREAVTAQCDADKLNERVRQAEAREKATAAALKERETEARTLRDKAKTADDQVEALKGELEGYRAKTPADVRDRACLPADDPWVRQGRPAGADGPRHR